MVKLPLARHPANHLLVQQLLLLGTLHEAHSATPSLHSTPPRHERAWARCGLSTNNNNNNSANECRSTYNMFFSAAFQLAQSDISYWEVITSPYLLHEQHDHHSTQLQHLFKFHPIINYILMQRINSIMHLWLSYEEGLEQKVQNIHETRTSTPASTEKVEELEEYEEERLTEETEHTTMQNNVQTKNEDQCQQENIKCDNTVIGDDSKLQETESSTITNSTCCRMDVLFTKKSEEEEKQIADVNNNKIKAIAACAHKWKHSLVLPPQKAVALYGPHTLLPSLSRAVHDNVSYAAALDHCAKLTNVLHPYGFQVGLVGSLRCGAPHASEVEVCVSLTAEATQECLSVIHDDGLATNELLNKEKEEEANWTRAFYGVTESVTEQMEPKCWWSSCGESKSKASLAQEEQHPLEEEISEPSCNSVSLLSSLSKEYCPTTCANALHVSIPAQILHRYRRAIDELVRSGYVIAGNYPFPHYLSSFRPFRSVLRTHTSIHSFGKYGFGDDGKVFSVRYDPHEPTATLPCHITNVETLRRMQLHRLILYFTPWKCFHTRRLFLTGPSAFTRHVIMQALSYGIEINKNGVFVSKYSETNSHKSFTSHCSDSKNNKDKSNNYIIKDDINKLMRNNDKKENEEEVQKEETSVETCMKNTQPLLRRAFEFAPLQSYKNESTLPTGCTNTQGCAKTDGKHNVELETNNKNLEEIVQESSTSSLSSSSYWLQRTRLLIQSEKDIFTLAGVPYVDPLNRAIYCQVHNLFPAKHIDGGDSKGKI